jgi:hypothetical protein
VTTFRDADAVALFGNRFLTEPAPAHHFPEGGMRHAEREHVKQGSG